VSEQKDPLDQALDLLVYAPIGLAFSLGETVPTLVEKGRQQVDVARVVGQVALTTAQQQAGRLVGQFLGRDTAGGGGAPASPGAASPVGRTGEAGPARARKASTDSHAAAAVTDAGLAIPGYDSLSASQVVPRLEGLARSDLVAIRAHETAGRGRRTVLSRIDQLLAGA
jgi:hypothetical protein